MLTNQMNVQFDFDAIHKDFVIFHIEKDEGDYYKTPLVDAIRQLGQCDAVVYQKGPSCYALFQNKNTKKALQLLKKESEAIDDAVTVQPVEPETLRPDTLAQLLSNALPILLDDYADYANTQGSLYYRILSGKSSKKMIHSFSMLQIQFTRNMEILLSVQSFTAVRKGEQTAKKAQYLFDPDTGELRRALDTDKATLPRFLKRAANPNRKVHVDFLRFDSPENYRASKVGILHQYLHDVEDMLSQYMTLSPLSICEGEHYIPKNRQLLHTLEETRKRLAGIPFYLEDQVQDTASQALLSILQQELAQYSKVHALTDFPVSNSVVLSIIHNREYYAERNLPDPHKSVRSGYILQHVTLENFQITGCSSYGKKEAEDAALKKVLLEIAIKMDIYKGVIRTYPWAELNLSEPIHFVMPEDIWDTNWFRCCRLTIQPDGHMQFDHWQSDYPQKDILQTELSNAFLNGQGKRDRQTEALVYMGTSPVCKIQKTDRYTLPNMDALENALSSTTEGALLDVSPIRELTAQLSASVPVKQQAAYQLILNNLMLLDDKATRKEIRGALHLKCSAGKDVNFSYWKQTGIRIGNDIRQKKNFETYFGATLDIRWYREENEIFFFSGNKSEALQQSFPHACRIRKLSACDSSDCTSLMSALLPMLAVDFVVASGWTVLPFPFKYLREYKAQVEMNPILPCPE